MSCPQPAKRIQVGLQLQLAAIIGARTDTDIIAGIESEFDTVLVFSSGLRWNPLHDFPYRPIYILNDVGDIVRDELPTSSERDSLL